MSSDNPRRVLYTTLFGRYEDLNELLIDDPGVPAYCFTDDPDLTSATWRIIHVKPMFPCDPVRSSRKIKVLGHEALEEFDEWLYIDNTVTLLSTPSEILAVFLAEHDLAIPTHSFRETVADEFDEVRAAHLDSDERVVEQLAHYEINYPTILTSKPLWSGILARRNTSAVHDWSVTWWNHILRYSRRDQLSVAVALQVTNLDFSRVEIDNFSSEFHTWPTFSARRLDVRHFDTRRSRFRGVIDRFRRPAPSNKNAHPTRDATGGSSTI